MEYSAQFYTILAYFDWLFMVFDTAIVLEGGNMTLYGLVWPCMTPVTGNFIIWNHLMNYFPLLSIPFTQDRTDFLCFCVKVWFFIGVIVLKRGNMTLYGLV